MDVKQFEKIVEARCKTIKNVLASKGEEYGSDRDALHNIKQAAKISSKEETPEQALLGMWRKHLSSLLDIIDETAQGVYPIKAVRNEKIGDSINYLILLEALLIEGGGEAE